MKGNEKIACLGPIGANGYMALLKEWPYIQERNVIFADMNSDVLDLVSRGKAEHGIVPIENSIEGYVRGTMSFWIKQRDDRAWILEKSEKEPDVYVTGELILPISHVIATNGRISFMEIGGVVSHEQAIGQCSEFLKIWALPSERVNSTSEAAQMVSQDPEYKNFGAITTELASEMYGLQIMGRDIQDCEDNATMFHKIGREMAPRTGNDKTAIMFWISNEKGTLLRILIAAGIQNIDMSSIHSIPLGKRMREYAFYIEFDGHRDDEETKATLSIMAAKCDVLVFLGSYPKSQETEDE